MDGANLNSRDVGLDISTGPNFRDTILGWLELYRVGGLRAPLLETYSHTTLGIKPTERTQRDYGCT